MTKNELKETLQKYANDEGFIRTKNLMNAFKKLGLPSARQTVLDNYIWPGRQAGILSAPDKRPIEKVDGGTMLVKFFKVKGVPK